MNTIELSDIDGDALTITSCDGSIWISCTSGAEEVTVGPFPRHLMKTFLTPGIAVENGTGSELLEHSAAGAPTSPGA